MADAPWPLLGDEVRSVRTITSERLILRPWGTRNADFLLDLQGRWEVVRHLGTTTRYMDTSSELFELVDGQ